MHLQPLFTRLTAFLLLVVPLHGKTPGIPGGLFTAAATTTDPAGVPYGYILLTSAQPETLHGQSFSVHIKPAAAAAAGEFSPQGIIAPVTTVAAASALLDRAAKLGQDRAAMERNIRFLYRKTVHPDYFARLNRIPQPGDPPAPDAPPQPGEPPVAEQAVLVITRATQNQELAGELGMMSLGSPGLALLSGRAWAGPLPTAGQMTTIEIRQRDGSTDGAVAGRVELLAGVPLKLPAPGAPVQVPITAQVVPGSDPVVRIPVKSNTSHLAIGLRWATTENLRRLSLLGHGFKVYRVDKTFALEAGWGTTRPQVDVLEGLITQMPDKVARLSNSLHLPPKIFTEATVADFFVTATGDATTAFVTDRNERCCGQPEAGPFPQGAEFLYFVVACDLLGQPGEVSMGGLGKACRTHRPLPPKEPTVEVDTTGTSPRVIVKWMHDPNANEEAPPSHYEILRGVGDQGTANAALFINPGNHLDLSVSSENPALLVPCGIVVAPAPLPLPAPQPVPAPDPPVRYPLEPRTWVDETPFLQPGETCWYAVRAVYRHTVTAPATACPTLYSDPTAAAYASLRRTDSPAPPQLCYQGTSFPFALVRFADGGFTTEAHPAAELRALLACRRLDTGISHVRFELYGLVGRDVTKGWEQTVYYPDTKGEANTSVQAFIRLFNSPLQAPFFIRCTAFTTTGAASRALDHPITFSTPSSGIRASWPLRAYEAGAYSLSSLPPAGSPFRTSITAGPAIAGTATASAGRGHSVASVNLGASPAVPVGFSPTRSALIETQTASGWTEVGAAQVSGGIAVIPGEFTGAIRATPLNIYAPAGCDGQVHQRTTASGAAAPLALGLCVTPGTREYRIYRQVDDGGLQLVAQSASLNLLTGTQTLADQHLPAVSASVQYFAQLVDGSGNASPMTALLSCPIKIVAPPPVPVLHHLRAASQNDLEMKWYCPAPGVERFEIFVETGAGGNHPYQFAVPSVMLGQWVPPPGGTPGPPRPGAVLTPAPQFNNIAHILSPVAVNLINTQTLNTRSHYTRRVGPAGTDLGPGPMYSLTIPVQGAGKYKVWIKSIGPTGGVSAPSNPLEFDWSAPRRGFVTGEKKVPWPARALPPSLAGEAFTPHVRVVPIPVTGTPANNQSISWPDNTGERYLRGVVIGQTPLVSLVPVAQINYNLVNPNTFLAGLTGSAGDRVLPAVLYRRQIPSSDFPQPPGDVIQVSPLIEHIAYYLNAERPVMADPFVAILNYAPPPEVDAFLTSSTFCILDTQPVIEGARYQYFLVRFDDKGEMRDVIDAGETQIDP